MNVDDDRSEEQEVRKLRKATDVSELVWKYFKDEIRESFLETQESLAAENVELFNKPTRRNQEGK